jgi:uncharacterized protein (TIRG00374 family)
MNKKLIAIFGLVVSAFFLYLFLKDVHWGELGEALSQANYLWLLPNIALIFGAMLLRAWRWGYMVNPVKKCSFHGLYAATMIGFMASNLLPARLGELARPLSLGHIERVSRAATLATTVVERVFDLLTLLALFTIIIFYKDLPDSQLLGKIEVAGWFFLGVTVVAVVVMIFLKVKTDSTLRMLNRILKIFPPRIQKAGSNILVKFASGLQVLSDAKAILQISALSILLWIIMAISNYFIFLAFGLKLPLDASFLVLAVVSVGIMLPSGPGFIGLYQYLTVISLDLYAVPDSTAQGVSIIMWATQYFTITLAGLYHLQREHLSLKQVEGDEQDEIDD